MKGETPNEEHPCRTTVGWCRRNLKLTENNTDFLKEPVFPLMIPSSLAWLSALNVCMCTSQAPCDWQEVKTGLLKNWWFNPTHITPQTKLNGALNRLNAILSLLHPLDRCRAPSAIGSAIGRPLSRPMSHPNTSGSPQPPCCKPLGRINRAIVVL